MWATVEDRLLSQFRARDAVRATAKALEAELRAGTITPTLAARRLLGEG
jgi:LAO/AO transport system kinase